MIKAECHSDDYKFEIEFDATLWFEQATPEQIKELRDCGMRGDYPADEVAIFMSGTNRDIEVMLEYCREQDECGFECVINEEDAESWLENSK